ncbi:GntR family transcriptional regulator [Utexia brackfieldae]|uniref:GntR family transcriptional regulator n=1 Tax=Utexia brackfieldae TaxID=3074108 RepID=UPI00370DC6C7
MIKASNMTGNISFQEMKQQLHAETACPLYIQLAFLLEKAIKTKSFPNHFLPVERDLAKNLAISRVTVSKSLSILENKKLISRKQGLGTRILFEQNNPLRYRGFNSSLTSLDEVTTIEWLLRQRMKASDEIAKYIEQPQNSEIAYLKLLRLANGQPISLEYIYAPLKFLSNPEIFDGALHEYWNERGFHLAQKYYRIKAIACDMESAIFLNVAKDSAVLKMTEITRNQFNEVLQVKIAITISDLYEYEFAS